MFRFQVCLLFGVVAGFGQEAVFGTSVVIPAGLKGDIYHLPRGTQSLDVLRGLKPVGSIYTPELNVPPQDFSIGFPGVTERFEWFAIDYNGRFWIAKPGIYRFKLISDDGAMLYVDGQLIIDNDGIHEPTARRGSIRLSAGVHRIRVAFMQGPAIHVALRLEVAGPGEGKARIFSTEEFKPPGDLELSRLGDDLEGAKEQDPELDLNVPEVKPAPKKIESKRRRR